MKVTDIFFAISGSGHHIPLLQIFVHVEKELAEREEEEEEKEERRKKSVNMDGSSEKTLRGIPCYFH